ncbi:MAG: serine/threonine protein kinase [Planctomycetes bacterium]|nr:serine/threonine protein kinase [Planctomycetota bacterium]
MANPSVPGYRVVSKIKDGGMYSVYKAEKYPYGDNSICAIKILLPKLAADRTALKRVKGEARIALALKHRYVIRTDRLITEEVERPCLVMEYFPGDTLKFLNMKYREELGNEALHRLAFQAAEALEYLHNQGVIHRDLKPENMLISPDRSDFRLIDFSLAQTASGLRWERWLRFGGGKIEGTVTYISPEQIQKKALDPRSDIYSLGVVFYELLAGRAPFSARDPAGILKAHLSQKPVAPRTHNKELSTEVERLVLQMMEKSPDLRPRDMGSVLRILTEACKKQGFVTA